MEDIFCISDLEQYVEAKLAKAQMVWQFISGGAGSMQSVKRNTENFKKWVFKGNVYVATQSARLTISGIA